ncbi:hypothetical protein EDC63_1065 [Sulfurirhabdus autotrophica]|uniref:Uncharacterized protein n=1 Tax=Sulfurirhabdus autotrophica TaxID=1706046 RepID=A0A4R3Y7V3_9PROT|nr:hypothetical protein EDC63_1065 [Sulfurirhabdus autotrophica]
MDIRLNKERRTGLPFGNKPPWLARGVMGGLIFSDRRKTSDRRTVNNRKNSESVGDS